MRSAKDMMETKSLWSRVGPSALSLTIVGAGVVGALRIVHAEDNAPVLKTLRAVTVAQDENRRAPDPATEAAKVRKAQEAEIRTREQLSTAARAAQRGEDAEERSLRREMEALEKQREALEDRIASLRRRMDNRPRRETETRERELNARRLRDNVLVVPQGKQNLTPDQRRMVDEAMKTAQEAMRMAEKAMQEAQRAMPNGQNFRFFHDGAHAPVVVPPVPKVLVPGITAPRGERKETPRVRGNARSFFFKDGDSPRVFQFDSSEMKGKDREKWQKEFDAEWSKKWPEFEKQMQQLQERMEQWQRDFERRMRDRVRDEDDLRSREDVEEDEDVTTKPGKKSGNAIKTSSFAKDPPSANAQFDDIL